MKAGGLDLDLSFEDAIRLLLKSWKLILGFTSAVALIVFLVNYFILPPWYESTAEIMPKITRSASSLDSLFGQAQAMSIGGGLSGLLGAAGTSSELFQFQEVLRSNNLYKNIFHKDPELLDVLRGKKSNPDKPSNVQSGMGKILKYVKIKPDITSLTIHYQNENPKLAKRVVTALLSGLQDFLTQNVVTQSQSAENFIKQRLTELNEELDKTETRLMRLKAGDKSLVTGDRSLQSEVFRTEREFARLGQMVNLLTQQYELAQVESKRDDPMYVTIDPPTDPVNPTSPQVLMNTMIGLILSFVTSCCFVLLSAKRSEKQFFQSQQIPTWPTKDYHPSLEN